MENGHIESFNSRPRNECLNVTQFLSLEDARAKMRAPSSPPAPAAPPVPSPRVQPQAGPAVPRQAPPASAPPMSAPASWSFTC